MQKVKGITINTDASFHPQQKVGGFAFWIKSDTFKLIGHGPFKREPENAIHAEIMCIGNALGALLFEKKINIPEAEFLIINTDCKEAIKHILDKNHNFDGYYVHKLWTRVKQKIKSNRNEFKHVKSYTRTDDKRSYVNEWCDTKAKEEMRKKLV